jgi:hypothetical protein
MHGIRDTELLYSRLRLQENAMQSCGTFQIYPNNDRCVFIYLFICTYRSRRLEIDILISEVSHIRL